MGRKGHKQDPSGNQQLTLLSWHGEEPSAEEAVREVGDLRRRIAQRRIDRDEAVAGERDQAAEDIRELQADLRAKEGATAKFARKRRKDFGEEKTVALTTGEVQLRKDPPSVAAVKGRKEADVRDLLVGFLAFSIDAAAVKRAVRQGLIHAAGLRALGLRIVDNSVEPIDGFTWEAVAERFAGFLRSRHTLAKASIRDLVEDGEVPERDLRDMGLRMKQIERVRVKPNEAPVENRDAAA